MNVDILINSSDTNLPDLIVVRYIVAVISACAAETVTYPIDLTKTRLQIQNEIATAKHGFEMEHRGMFGTMLNICKKEGVHKLWSGLPATWHRHTIYAGCRLIFYERFRQLLADFDIKMTMANAIVCAMTAGSLAQLLASPMDLVKIKMQTKGRKTTSGKTSEITGTLSVYKLVYKQSGILGFWRGAIPNMQRAALTNVGNLATYDFTKFYLKKTFNLSENLFLHGSAAFVAGLFSALLSTPADVLKSRLMNQPVGPDGKGAIYKGVIDCLRQSIQNEGFASIYKGFIPVWMRMAPFTMVNWVTFETIMLYIGGRPF